MVIAKTGSQPATDARPSSTELLEAAERLVARLRFDIHDGPLQHTAVLANQLSAFANELRELVPDALAYTVLDQHLDDLQSIVCEIEQDLRELAVSAGARRDNGSLAEALAGEVAHFRRRSGVDAELDLDGDLGRMTPSQRIAVTRLVEEALANVREHAVAQSVRISVRRLNGSLNVCVEDDGHGFDVDRALRRAARDHRLGLIAMAERVRLLGGELDIDSRPGGPTSVSAVLPAWNEAQEGAEPDDSVT